MLRTGAKASRGLASLLEVRGKGGGRRATWTWANSGEFARATIVCAESVMSRPREEIFAGCWSRLKQTLHCCFTRQSSLASQYGTSVLGSICGGSGKGDPAAGHGGGLHAHVDLA